MSLAGLVLLAACANLGGLFSARTADRSKELGIRIAIGSSRARILRQLLTESVLVSLFGGIAASLLATGLLRALTQWHPRTEIPVQFLVEPDRLVYLFAALLAVATGVLFGAIPARQVWKTDPNQTMKAAGGTSAVSAASRSATSCWWCRSRSAACWSRHRLSLCKDCAAPSPCRLAFALRASQLLH